YSLCTLFSSLLNLIYRVPCLIFFFLFFVYTSVSPQHLHSFPTRRSSDLCLAAPGNFGVSSRSACSGDTTDGSGTTAGAPRVATRSEEHTSELQSRVDLVCRLLLEKKNNIAMITGFIVNTIIYRKSKCIKS